MQTSDDDRLPDELRARRAKIFRETRAWRLRRAREERRRLAESPAHRSPKPAGSARYEAVVKAAGIVGLPLAWRAAMWLDSQSVLPTGVTWAFTGALFGFLFGCIQWATTVEERVETGALFAVFGAVTFAVFTLF